MNVFTLAQRGGTPLPLPNPGRGLEVALDKIGGQQTTMTGALVAQTVAVKRTWSMPYPWLTDVQYDALAGWVDGRHGLGPFELRQDGVAGFWLVVPVGSLPKAIPYVGRCATTLVLREV